MKWGNFWNPWFPVTENKVGRVTTYFTEQMSKSSQMVRRWEASKFAMDPRKAQEFKRQGWGRALNQMCLWVQNTGRRRERKWDTRLETEVKWQVCRLTAAQLLSNQKTGVWGMKRSQSPRENTDTVICMLSVLLPAFGRVIFQCWICCFDLNLCFLLLLLL